ncbi:MAG: acyl-CoA dehydrogenase, partial [Planctomycetota bacterium]
KGRLSVAVGALGIHRAALTACISFTKQREQFGKPIASYQMVQERIADMTVELMAARQLVYRCARLRAAGNETHADLAAAKLYSTEAASRAADQAIMLHGGRGYSTEHAVERLLRDSIGLRIYEGTSMIQKLILSRAVLE